MKIGDKVKYVDTFFKRPELEDKIFTISKVFQSLSEWWICLEEVEGSFYPSSFRVLKNEENRSESD